MWRVSQVVKITGFHPVGWSSTLQHAILATSIIIASASEYEKTTLGATSELIRKGKRAAARRHRKSKLSMVRKNLFNIATQREPLNKSRVERP